MGGRGGSSGIPASRSKTTDVQLEQAISVIKPTTKTEYIEKLEVLAEIGQAGYKTVAKTTEWENYGKSRTYLKVDAYRESDGKFHHSFDYGYFDNKSNLYVASKNINNLQTREFDLGGNNKITTSQVAEILKKKKQRGDL